MSAHERGQVDGVQVGQGQIECVHGAVVCSEPTFKVRDRGLERAVCGKVALAAREATTGALAGKTHAAGDVRERRDAAGTRALSACRRHVVALRTERAELLGRQVQLFTAHRLVHVFTVARHLISATLFKTILACMCLVGCSQGAFCSGVALSPDVVLTARHCVESFDVTEGRRLSSVQVRVGAELVLVGHCSGARVGQVLSVEDGHAYVSARSCPGDSGGGAYLDGALVGLVVRRVLGRDVSVVELLR